MRFEPEKSAERKKIAEHPFGTIKRAFNQGYLLLRGLRNVTSEVGLTMLACNMRRVLNILGPAAFTCLMSSGDVDGSLTAFSMAFMCAVMADSVHVC
jgi:hypothetical protein